MQTIQFSFKKSTWLILLVGAVFSLFYISSCNSSEGSVKGECITLSRSKIVKTWVNDGYFANINYLNFITYYNSNTKEFQVFVQAYQKNSETEYVPIGPLVKLNTGGSCSTKLPPMAVSDNIADLSELGVRGPNGSLIEKFDYIALTPYRDSLGYLRYNTRFIDRESNTIAGTASITTVPCPPCRNCRPPCCKETCIDDSCPIKTDSLPDHDSTSRMSPVSGKKVEN